MEKKELIIANLRKHIAGLEKVYKSIQVIETEVSELITELEDDSKIGTPTEYDFGSAKFADIRKKLIRDIRYNVKILNSVSESIRNIQKDSSFKIREDMKEFEN